MLIAAPATSDGKVAAMGLKELAHPLLPQAIPVCAFASVSWGATRRAGLHSRWAAHL